MATLAEFRGWLEAHSPEIVPTSWVLRHRDAVVIPEPDARVLEYSPNSRVKLASDPWFAVPDRPKDCGHVKGRDLIDGAREKWTTVGGPEVPAPLIANLFVRRLPLSISHYQLSYVAKR